MARVRLLQLHQEQQQHGPITGQSSTASGTTVTTNQWLDLVPSNPILPQIALPGSPSALTSSNNHHHHMHNHHHNHHHLQHHHQQDENGGGGSSSTESAHQARSSGRHNQPSKIPVVKPTSYAVAGKPPSSYREQQHTPRDPYPSWNKCKSDQSLPRNWDPIKSTGGVSSIGGGSAGGGKQRGVSKQDSLQDNGNGHVGGKQHHSSRARRNSGSGGGGASLTRAKSQNHHHPSATSAANSATAKDRTGGGTIITAGTVSVAASHPSPTDDTNKVRPTKRFTNILNSWMRKS